MSSILCGFKRKNVKRHTCRRCKCRMEYKPGYGYICLECGWSKYSDKKKYLEEVQDADSD